jgi:hypothetical protein
MNEVSGAEAQIRAKVRIVVADEPLWGVLSTGERVAVALVLGRPDLLRFWGTIDIFFGERFLTSPVASVPLR